MATTINPRNYLPYELNEGSPNSQGYSLITGAPTPAFDITKLSGATPTKDSEAVADTSIDYQALIKQMAEAQKQSRYSALDSALSSSMGALANEEAGIKPRYYNARNQVGADTDVSRMNFAQYMAGKGIKGNAGAMPEIYSNAAMNSKIGNLNIQEQAAFDTIARDRSTLQEKYNADKTSIGNDIDAQSLQNYISQMNADRAYKLQADSAALEQKRYADTTQQRQQSDYENTINRFYDDFAAEIDNVTNDGDPSNDWQIPLLQSARQNKVTTIAAQQAAAEEKAKALQTAADKETWDRALDLWKQTGVANEEIARILGIPVNTKTAGYNIDSMRIAKSGSSTPSPAQQRATDNANYDTNYNQAVNTYSNMDPDEMYSDLTTGKDDIVSQVGPENYNRLVKLNQDQYYNRLLTTWRNSNPDAILASLDKNPQGYIDKIGRENFNELYAKAKAQLQ